MMAVVLSLTTLIIPVILAITLHEAAHGYTAWKRGDDTAYRLNRVTLNPLSHIDLIGTLAVPALTFFLSGFLFGWAKPVPVNPARLKNPRYDMVLVAAAGPLINLILALISLRAIAWTSLWETSIVQGWIQQNLVNFLVINVILLVFNLLPIPPLDGGRIAVGLLPPRLSDPLRRLEPYGFLILIGLIFILPLIGEQLRVDLDVIGWLLRDVVFGLIQTSLRLAT